MYNITLVTLYKTYFEKGEELFEILYGESRLETVKRMIAGIEKYDKIVESVSRKAVLCGVNHITYVRHLKAYTEVKASIDKGE